MDSPLGRETGEAPAARVYWSRSPTVLTARMLYFGLLVFSSPSVQVLA
jgi:hypothetical protein